MGYRGSVAHNMYIPNTDPNSIDDIDLMGVFMAPEDHYIGIKKCRETFEKYIGKYDVVNYEFKKFISLLLKSNPNVLSLLWLKENHYIKIDTGDRYADEKSSYFGRCIIEHRDIFVSKKAYHAFSGYAFSQLKRMQKFNHEGYMGSKRKKIVEKYGYDIKNAAHCIRLLKMGIEFLTDGVLHVHREDAPMLLEIKCGEWTLEQVKSEASRLFKLADEAYIRSKLPPEPDYHRANNMVKDIMWQYLRECNVGT
jgi:predicted nucleotidyltransferase